MHKLSFCFRPKPICLWVSRSACMFFCIPHCKCLIACLFSICLPSCLSVTVSVAFLPSCLLFRSSFPQIPLSSSLSTFFLVECLPACSYSWMQSFQKLNSNQTAMLFVKASVLRGDFFVEKLEVLWPEPDIRLPLLCSLILLCVFIITKFGRQDAICQKQATSFVIHHQRCKQKHNALGQIIDV